MKFSYSWLLLAVLPLLALRCRRDDDDAPGPTLPPETQDGRNTMGCYVNGRPWVLADDPNSMGAARQVRAGRGELFIYAPRLTDHEDNAVIIALCYAFTGTGTYDLYFPPDSCSEAYYRDYTSNKAYVVAASSHSTLTVTRYDPQARVVAGRFSFTGVAAPGDTVRLTEGRFDLKF